MIRTIHATLRGFGESTANFSLVFFALVLHALPIAALCASLYIGALIVYYIGIGLIWDIPISVLWFLFVCIYVLDHVQPIVAEAATRLWPSN